MTKPNKEFPWEWKEVHWGEIGRVDWKGFHATIIDHDDHKPKYTVFYGEQRLISGEVSCKGHFVLVQALAETALRTLAKHYNKT